MRASKVIYHPQGNADAFYTVEQWLDFIAIDPSTGNVGIGTTTPATKLQVSGSFLSGGGDFELRDGGTADSTAVRVFNNGGNLYLQNGSGDNTYFRDKTANITVTVQNGGNVGIGKAPAVKCDVDGPVCVKSYTVAGVPAANAAAGQIIYVSNETGGAVLAFSDGTNWRRVTDRAVVS